jgi:hypothetical protein
MLKPENVARDLTVQEPVLVFCVASGTDLLRAGVFPPRMLTDAGIFCTLCVRRLASADVEASDETVLYPGNMADHPVGQLIPVRSHMVW